MIVRLHLVLTGMALAMLGSPFVRTQLRHVPQDLGRSISPATWSAARAADSLEGLPLAFEFQDAISRPLIYARIRELGSQLRAGLQRIAGVEVVTPAHFALAAGIVSVRIPGRNPAEIVERIAREDRIVVGRATHGAGFDAVRISVHPTNDGIDVDRAVAAVQRHV